MSTFTVLLFCFVSLMYFWLDIRGKQSSCWHPSFITVCCVSYPSVHSSVTEQDLPKKGVWLERLLTISELREEDFNTNYTCRVYNSRGMPEGYFTLIPEGNKVTVVD